MKRRLTLLGCLLIITSCAQMTCSQKRHRAIEWNNKGVQKFSQRMHAPAVRDFQAALREDPTYLKSHANIATVYREMQKWDEASRHLKEVVTGEPNNAQAHYELGECYQNLNRPDLAQKHYSETIRVNPQHYRAHFASQTFVYWFEEIGAGP